MCSAARLLMNPGERSMEATMTNAQAAALPKPASNSTKKLLLVAIKGAVSLGALFYIYNMVLGREGIAELQKSISALHWEWFGAALCMQLAAISCGIARWRGLLTAQGLHASWRYLSGVWMIGRFWGLVTPGGFGLGAWRFYETVRHTSLIARAMAVVGVEKCRPAGLRPVVVAGSVYGFQFIGARASAGQRLLHRAGTAGLTLLAKPQAVRSLAKLLPKSVHGKVETLVDAVCAYHGKWRLLAQTALLSVGVHAFNNLIYVCAARALGIELSVGTVFFGTSLQIIATMVPVSINGIGLREAAAVALYTSPAVGLTPLQALLVPTIGFAADVFVSIFGMPLFLLRKTDRENPFTVDATPQEPC